MKKSLQIVVLAMFVTFVTFCSSATKDTNGSGDDTANTDLARDLAGRKEGLLSDTYSFVYLSVMMEGGNISNSRILASNKDAWEKGWDITFPRKTEDINEFMLNTNILDAKNERFDVKKIYYDQDGMRITEPSKDFFTIFFKRGKKTPIYIGVDFNLVSKIYGMAIYSKDGEDLYAMLPPINVSHQ